MEMLAFLGLSLALGVVPGPVAAPPPDLVAQLAQTAPEEPEEEPSEELGEQLRLRDQLKPWHIVFGNLAWAATNVTTVLGVLHFNDRWGWSGDVTDTGCERGDPILGTDFCPPGIATPHLATAIGVTVFFTTSFTLGLFMPDLLDAAEADGGRGDLLRIHGVLRWAVLGGMIAQVILGPIVTIMRDEPFETGRALAVTHLVVGGATWAMMTAQGVVGSLLTY